VSHFELFESYIPFDLLVPQNFLLAFLVLTLIINLRYFVLVGSFWWFYYRQQPARTRAGQIYKSLPTTKQQKMEIGWSLLSSVLFALAGLGMGIFWQLGWTRIYLNFHAFPIWYLPVSAVILALLHDTYFYWIHRALHHPWLLKRWHLVHHNSLEPSPWASFSFHPAESVLNAIALPILIFILPLHPVVLLWHLTLMTVTAILNHLGFELLPRGTAKHPLGRFWIGAVHHSLHHEVFRENFGLFFSFWDHLCGTESANYQQAFAKAKGER